MLLYHCAELFPQTPPRLLPFVQQRKYKRTSIDRTTNTIYMLISWEFSEKKEFLFLARRKFIEKNKQQLEASDFVLW